MTPEQEQAILDKEYKTGEIIPGSGAWHTTHPLAHKDVRAGAREKMTLMKTEIFPPCLTCGELTFNCSWLGPGRTSPHLLINEAPTADLKSPEPLPQIESLEGKNDGMDR